MPFRGVILILVLAALFAFAFKDRLYEIFYGEQEQTEEEDKEKDVIKEIIDEE